jgi:hypothetical protein
MSIAGYSRSSLWHTMQARVKDVVEAAACGYVLWHTMQARVKDVVEAAACGYVLLHTLLRIVQAQVLLLTTHY